METQITVEAFAAANHYLVTLLQKELVSVKAQLIDAQRELETAQQRLAALDSREPE